MERKFSYVNENKLIFVCARAAGKAGKSVQKNQTRILSGLSRASHNKFPSSGVSFSARRASYSHKTHFGDLAPRHSSAERFTRIKKTQQENLRGLRLHCVPFCILPSVAFKPQINFKMFCTHRNNRRIVSDPITI
jgi:hypothetical protein